MTNLKPIYVSLGLSALLWSCAAQAHEPETTNFVCVDESAANAIAKASVLDVLNGSSDDVARPYIDASTCFFLPRSVEIHVVRLCRTFAKFSKVQVVAFNETGADPSRLFYAIKRLAIYEGAI